MGAITSLAISGNAHADTVCYRVKLTMNGQDQHTNSVCREDSGNIKVQDDGQGMFKTLFREENYSSSPDQQEQPSICVSNENLKTSKGEKSTACKPKEGFSLNGQALVNLLREYCGARSCKLTYATGVTYNVTIGQAEQINEDGSTPTQPAGPATGTSETDGQDACYKGSGPLGWLICPAITALTGLGNGMWGFVEENFMQIQAPELFGPDSGVGAAWRTIRDIANVLFIILFLVVIFSQITGLGIDNYGIKKIMPKLIVVAILVNLSYIICELAIDLSNIIGSGASSLLSGLASDTISEAGVTTEGAGVASSSLTQVLAVGSTVLYGWLNPIGPIAIGLGAISIVFSVVAAIATLYFILVIREAGVVLLVAIAPIAMVCYLLPNTEKLYRKWFDLFKALLVVYPLCGLMVGAGKLASGVLATIDSSAMKITAMIVQVVPFFLIPTLLKSSLSMMGNIGARISSMTSRTGRMAGGAAGRALQESDWANKWANRMGMVSPFRGKRAAAFEAEYRRAGDSRRIKRNSNMELMKERLEAAQAEDEARSYNENISRRVASMRRGGIQTDGGLRNFNADGVNARLSELALKDRLNENEIEEVGALMHAASDMPGGTGAMARIIRAGNTSTAFMRAAGTAYSRDTSIQNKLAGDAGASYFTEQFTPGGAGQTDEIPSALSSFDTFKRQDSTGYEGQIKRRAASYQVGLSQSGGENGALGEYLDTLEAQDFERIAGDSRLLNGIDKDNQDTFFKVYRERFPDSYNNMYSGNTQQVAPQAQLQGQTTQPQPQPNRASSSDYTTNIGETDGGADFVSE